MKHRRKQLAGVAADIVGWVMIGGFLLAGLRFLGLPSAEGPIDQEIGATEDLDLSALASQPLNLDTPGVLLSAAISPDGSQAVMSVLAARGERVQRVNLAEAALGAAEATMAMDVPGGLSWRTVRWSPAGSQLAARVVRSKASQDAYDYLRITDLDGRLVTNVITSTHGVGWFEWSPDGNHIAYISPEGEFMVYSLVSGALTTIEENVTTPAGGGGAYFAWAPDAGQLAVGKLPSIGRGNLFTVDVPGGAVTQTTHFQGYGMPDPVWSPSGEQIAFFIGDDTVDGTPELWTVRPDGSELRQELVLPEHPDVPFSYAGYALWLPGTARLIFVWDNELWSINVDGTDLEPLVGGVMVPAERPTASLDGSKLLVRTGVQGTDTPIIIDLP